MPDHFIARLIAGTTKTTPTGEGLGISLRPAITPDILPETFCLPDQRLVNSTSAAFRKLAFSSSTEAASAAAEDTTEQRRPSQSRDLIDIMNAKDTKIGKSETNNFKVVAPVSADRKTEGVFAVDSPISSEEIDVNENAKLEKSANNAKGLNDVQKAMELSGFKLQENSMERRGTEDLRGPPPRTAISMVMPRESAELRDEEGSSKAHHLLQTWQKIEVPPEPEITIKIGRIDVRAVMPQKSTKTQQFAPPQLSLKEYLKQRSEGRL